jgi:hypothetical protein
MGVKSTVDLTRQQAEEKFVDLTLETSDVKRYIRAAAVMLDDTELERQLMIMNDKRAGGEGFDNYNIID